jgi:hypothetical protein
MAGHAAVDVLGDPPVSARHVAHEIFNGPIGTAWHRRRERAVVADGSAKGGSFGAQAGHPEIFVEVRLTHPHPLHTIKRPRRWDVPLASA